MKNVKKYIFTNGIDKNYDLYRNIFDFKYIIKNNDLVWRQDDRYNLKNFSSFTFSDPKLLDNDNLLFEQDVKVTFVSNDYVNNLLNSEYISDPSDYGYIRGQQNEILIQKLKNYPSKKLEFDNFDFYYDHLVNDESLNYISFEANYNFYVKKYEERIKRLPEEVLPNFYVFSLNADPITNNTQESNFSNSSISGENSAYTDFNSKFDNFISLNNNLLFFSGVPRGRQFIDKYTSAYDEVNVDFLQTYKERFSNVVMDLDNVDYIKQIENYSKQYPYSIDISFTSKDNELIDIFKEHFLNGKIINDIKFSDEYLKTNKNVDIVTLTDNTTINVNKQSIELNFSDFKQWLDSFINENYQNIANSDDIYFNDIIPDVYNEQTLPIVNINRNINQQNNVVFTNTDITQEQLTQTTLLQSSLIQDVLLTKIRNLMVNNLRSYKDILFSNFSKNYPIFYKIEKMDKNDNIIQTFYLANVPGLDITKYIDTQVKPYKLYKYKIYSINVVFGTKYRYKTKFSSYNDVPRSENDLGQAEILQSDAVRNELTQQSDPIITSLSDVEDSSDIEPIFIFNSTDEVISQEQSNNNNLPIFSGVNNINVVDSNNTSQQSILIETGVINNNLIELTSQTQDSIIQDANLGSIAILPTDSDNNFDFIVEYEPSIKLIELEISDIVQGSVKDNPPLYPEVLFLPLMNKLSSFYICFFEIFSQIEDKFIKIFEEDNQYQNSFSISAMRNRASSSKSPLLNDNKIFKFTGEGDTDQIQIFRTDKEPTEYKDFSLYKTIKFQDNKNILENITVNKNYYYFFRTIDTKNNISNPSPIYRVILFSNGDRSFLDVKEFNFKPIKFTQKKIKFKKYIKIKPSTIQQLYNHEKEEIGLPNKKAYDNDFRMKITSKHTGKQININFKFIVDNKQ